MQHSSSVSPKKIKIKTSPESGQSRRECQPGIAVGLFVQLSGR